MFIMATKTEVHYSLEKYHTADFTITDLLKGMLAAQAHKDDEKAAKDLYTADTQSLSSQFMVLAKMASSLEEYELLVQESRKRIKDGSIDAHNKAVPQAFYDASSICRKGWKLGTLAHADSVETLKKLNSEALKAQSAKNPEGFDDFVHLLRDAYKAHAIEDSKEQSPAQAAMLADLAGLVERYKVAATKATGGKTPKAKAKATKAA